MCSRLASSRRKKPNCLSGSDCVMIGHSRIFRLLAHAGSRKVDSLCSSPVVPPLRLDSQALFPAHGPHTRRSLKHVASPSEVTVLPSLPCLRSPFAREARCSHLASDARCGTEMGSYFRLFACSPCHGSCGILCIHQREIWQVWGGGPRVPTLRCSRCSLSSPRLSTSPSTL